MSDYIHRITVAVPEAYINIANQLALIAGEFPADINTFRQASWQDKDGNKYAVCSAVAKPVVLSIYHSKLSELELPEFKQEANIEQAQQALDMMVLYDGTQQVTTNTIMCAVDYDPLPTLEAMGLSVIELEEID